MNKISAPPCGSLDLLPPCVGQKNLDVANQTRKEESCFLLDFLQSSSIWLTLKIHPSYPPDLNEVQKAIQKRQEVLWDLRYTLMNALLVCSQHSALASSCLQLFRFVPTGQCNLMASTREHD